MMKKIGRTIFVWGMLLHFTTGRAQSTIELQKGDTLPALSLNLQKGDSMYKGNLKNFAGKILLLDFWAVHCLDCIASLPKLYALQNKFKDELKILVVTTNSQQEVQYLWKKFKDNEQAREWVNAGKQMTFVYNDTLIQQYFKPPSLPSHAWIDKEQRFIALAYASSTNSKNIKALLKDEAIRLDEMAIINIDPDNPLSWIQSTGENPAPVIPLSYSMFTPHIEFGMGGARFLREVKDSISKLAKEVKILNSPILELYRYAYKGAAGFRGFIPYDRILIESSRKEEFYFTGVQQEYPAWAKNHTYCFGLQLPPGCKENALEIMQTDLDRFFNLHTRIEKRSVKCFVFKKLADFKSTEMVGGARQRVKIMKEGKLYYVLQNVGLPLLYSTVSGVIYAMDKFKLVLNETDNEGIVNMQIAWNEDKKEISLPSLQTALRAQGLELVEEFREVSLLVISDRK